MSTPTKEQKPLMASPAKSSGSSKSTWSQSEAHELALFALGALPTKLSQQDAKSFATYIGRSEEAVKTFWNRKIAPQSKQVRANAEAKSKAVA